MSLRTAWSFGWRLGVGSPLIILGVAMTLTVILAPIGIPLTWLGARIIAVPIQKEIGSYKIRKQPRREDEGVLDPEWDEEVVMVERIVEY